MMQASRQWIQLINKVILERPWLLPIVMVLLYGFKHTDFKDFQSLTSNPFTTLVDPGRQFLHSSPLIFFLGWPVTHAVGSNASYFLTTVLGLVALAASLTRHFRRIAPGRRATVCIVMLSSPILLVLLRWMGKSDPYVIALYLAMLGFKGRSGPTAVCSALMIVAHREIGTVMLAGGLILGQIAVAPAVAGALVGHSLLSAYQSMLDPKPAGRLSFALSVLQSSSWRNNPILHVVLGPGWFWLFIARLFRNADAWRVILALLLCYAAAAATADYTRVFIVCAVPLIIYAADRIATDPRPSQGAVSWPALFALQAQIEFGDQVRDSLWWSS